MSLEDDDFAMQPLNRVKYVRGTDWGSHYKVMLRRPTLAAQVAQCIAFWAEIEVLLGMLLAFLLHANEKAVLAIYAGLENRAAQLRMLESAASSILPQNHADIVSVVLNSLVRPCMRYRDKLAHWCWGFSDELPEALLIRDQERHLAGFAEALRKQGETKQTFNLIATDHSTVFVIRNGDLDRYLDQLAKLELILRQTMASVWVSNSEVEHAEYLQLLSIEPQLQAGLSRLRKGRQKTPDTQQPSPPPDQSDKG